MLFAWLFKLDSGTAAGLAAGGLTQSAMIGSADSAISHLGLSSVLTHTLQANVAVGYAICYIFGSFGPILLLATVFPLVMRWNLRQEAIALAADQSHGHTELEPGQFNALHDLQTRLLKVSAESALISQTPRAAAKTMGKHIAVELIIRDGKPLDFDVGGKILSGDIVAVTAREEDLLSIEPRLGVEVPRPGNIQLVKEERFCVLSNKQYTGLTLKALSEKLVVAGCYGFFIKSVVRLGESLPVTPDLVLKRGDEIVFSAMPSQLNAVAHEVGASVSNAPITDFIIFGVGIALGFAFGLVSIPISGVSVHIGSGVGCLISGLIFGWLRSVRPLHGALPVGASNFLRDFGLAVFVATVGLTAGPQAVTTIRAHGLDLFLLGIGVTVIPQILSFYVSYYVLRIRNPINLLATIAGGRSANPGFAALLEKAGNATPVMPFTATYTLANIWLTLWGPVIIALITRH